MCLKLTNSFILFYFFFASNVAEWSYDILGNVFHKDLFSKYRKAITDIKILS